MQHVGADEAEQRLRGGDDPLLDEQADLLAVEGVGQHAEELEEKARGGERPDAVQVPFDLSKVYTCVVFNDSFDLIIIFDR